MPQPFISVLFAILLSSGILWADEPATQPATTQASATQPAPKTHTVKRDTISRVLEAEGVFQPVDPFKVRLRPKVYGGELTILSAAAHGSSVKAGDTILQLDPQYLQRDLAAAVIALTVAKANLTKAKADLELGQEADALAMRLQTDLLKNNEDYSKWWEKVDGPNMLKSSELNLKMIKDFVQDQEDELDQLRKMYKTEDLTTATADIVIRRALRRLEQGKEVASMYEGNAERFTLHNYPIAATRVTDTLEASKQAVAQVTAAQDLSKVQRDTSLATAQAAVELAELKVTDLKKDLELLTVKAPSDGVVLYGELTDKWQRNDPDLLRPTEKIGAQQVVMILYAPGKLRLNLNVPEAKLLWVEPGTDAPVSPAALPQVTYAGKVARGNASMMELLVTLPEVDARLVPGMKGSVRIDGGRAENVLVIPLSAVSAGKVWVRNADGKDEPRSVTLGITDGTSIEVKDGLKEGDEILQQPPK